MKIIINDIETTILSIFIGSLIGTILFLLILYAINVFFG